MLVKVISTTAEVQKVAKFTTGSIKLEEGDIFSVPEEKARALVASFPYVFAIEQSALDAAKAIQGHKPRVNKMLKAGSQFKSK